MRRALVLAVALLAGSAGAAQAEIVAPGVQDGALAVGRDGVPRVAFLRGRTPFVATRRADGTWRTARAPRVPDATALVVGLAVGAGGRPLVLVEDVQERWLVLLRRVDRGWRTFPIVRRTASGSAVGWSGLTVDRRGLPVVAYALWLRSGKTYLRLVRTRPDGRLRVRRVTRLGFPPSLVPPAASPLLMPDGVVHVLETYGTGGAVGTIEWAPKASDWLGQFLHGGAYDYPIGPVLGAVAPDETTYAAWTDLYSAFGDSLVFLAVHGHPVESHLLFERAFLAGLALSAAEGPEVAANEWVSATDLGLPGDGVLWAGRLADAAGPTAEFDGKLAAFAVGKRGERELLLAQSDGLSWLSSAGPLLRRVTLTAEPAAGGGVALTGRVEGAAAGTVSIYRERPGELRELVTLAPIAPDGTFAAADLPSTRPLVYRAVYADPSTGLPHAALLRTAAP